MSRSIDAFAARSDDPTLWSSSSHPTMSPSFLIKPSIFAFKKAAQKSLVGVIGRGRLSGFHSTGWKVFHSNNFSTKLSVGFRVEFASAARISTAWEMMDA